MNALIVIDGASEKWDRDDGVHCPSCGLTTVWHRDDPGDYYYGPKFCCASCGVVGQMWSDFWTPTAGCDIAVSAALSRAGTPPQVAKEDDEEGGGL